VFRTGQTTSPLLPLHLQWRSWWRNLVPLARIITGLRGSCQPFSLQFYTESPLAVATICPKCSYDFEFHTACRLSLAVLHHMSLLWTHRYIPCLPRWRHFHLVKKRNYRAASLQLKGLEVTGTSGVAEPKKGLMKQEIHELSAARAGAARRYPDAPLALF